MLTPWKVGNIFRSITIPLVFGLIVYLPLMAQPRQDSLHQMMVHYGKKGVDLETRDHKFLLQVQSRFQFRFATPSDQDPVSFDDYPNEKQREFKINRARLKVGGHAFQPRLKYY